MSSAGRQPAKYKVGDIVLLGFDGAPLEPHRVTGVHKNPMSSGNWSWIYSTTAVSDEALQL